MINNSLQVWIQIQLISPSVVIHSETWDLAKQGIRISQKHFFFIHLSHLLRNNCKLSSTGAGKIVHVHLNIIPDHFFKNTRYTHTHQTNVWLHFCLIFCK